MPTPFFVDAFTGTGDINGHSPDTAFSGLTWVNNVAPNDITLSGGFASAVDTSAAGFGTADYGDYVTDYGQPKNIKATVHFRTAASITPDVGNVLQGAQVSFYTGATTVGFSILSILGAEWVIANLADGSQTTFAGIAANTDYTAVLTVFDGHQKIELNGQTIESFVAYDDPSTGLNGIGIGTGKWAKLDSISTEDAGARGLINVTLPMLALQATVGARAEVSLPALLVDFEAAETMRLPMLRVAFRATGALPAVLNAALPMLRVVASGHVDPLNSIDVTLPMLTVRATGGAHTAVTLPALTVSASGTVTTLAGVSIALPMLAVSAHGVVTGSASARLMLPMLTATARGGAAAPIVLPALTMQASASTGATASLAALLPMLVVDASATVGVSARLMATLPMLVAGPWSRAEITLPMLTVDFVAHEVIAALYEAYAVNLGHLSDKANDQVTRYTNFPFLAVLRYGAHYYGVAADGVYRLGGTTDYAATPTDVAWAWKTALSDFGVPQKKTLNACYFAGRFGPASTVSVYAGEDIDSIQRYDYQTLRDSTAKNYRQKFSKGVKARYFAMGDEGSSELSLATLEFDISQLARRI